MHKNYIPFLKKLRILSGKNEKLRVKRMCETCRAQAKQTKVLTLVSLLVELSRLTSVIVL